MSFEKFRNLGPVPLFTTFQQMRDHVYRRSEKAFAEGHAARDAIKNTAELELYNRRKRAEFINSLGGIPFDGTPLDAELKKVKVLPEYTVEAVIFKSRRDTYVTGNVYVPNTKHGRLPAVLFVCGHSDDGRFYENYQQVCAAIVKTGILVLAIDPVGQGERSEYYNKETGEYEVMRATSDHDMGGIYGLAAGAPSARYFLADEMRAIDYLISRPDVDPDRIGITGNSGGGTQTLASIAVDDRIAAAAPGTFTTSREAYLYTGQSQDSEQIWPSATLHGYDHVNAIMNFAPKPLAIMAVSYDFFPIDGTYDTFEEAKRFYEMYGKGENIRICEDAWVHSYTKNLAVMAAEFFSEVFLGEKITVDLSDFTPIPEAELYATGTGNVMGEIGGAKFMRDDIAELAEQMEKARLSLSPFDRLSAAKAWLEERVYSFRTAHRLNFRKPEVRAVVIDGIKATSGMWRTQADMFGYSLVVTDEKYGDGDSLPLCIAVWDDGTFAFDAHAEFIKAKCAEGYRVAILDVTGQGGLRQQTLREERHNTVYGTMYKLTNDLIFLGDSMAAHRAYEVIRAVEALKGAFPTASVELYGEGRCGTAALVAAFLDRSLRFTAGESLVLDFRRDFVAPYLKQYDDDLGVIYPEMLRYFDYRELYDAIK